MADDVVAKGTIKLNSLREALEAMGASLRITAGGACSYSAARQAVGHSHACGLRAGDSRDGTPCLDAHFQALRAVVSVRVPRTA